MQLHHALARTQSRVQQPIIRPATQRDIAQCGRIMYDAFAHIADQHGFPADLPSLEAATALATAMISNASAYGVVAEVDGVVVGSNFLSESDSIRGVGPITVQPTVQGLGIGRRLMQAVLKRADDSDGVRLVQDSFNMCSLSLYASLGFEVREPLVVMAGRASEAPPAGVTVRPMCANDIDRCDAITIEAHGISRRKEIEAALGLLAPLVVERQGRVRAYMTAPGTWIPNHGAAEADADMRALIMGASSAGTSMSFLLPLRQKDLLEWCLGQGLRAIKPMTLMTIGQYRTATQPYIPSVFY